MPTKINTLTGRGRGFVYGHEWDDDSMTSSSDNRQPTRAYRTDAFDNRQPTRAYRTDDFDNRNTRTAPEPYGKTTE